MYGKILEQRHHSAETLAVLVVGLCRAVHGFWQDLVHAFWGAEGEEEVNVPGVVGGDYGFCSLFLGSEGRHVGGLVVLRWLVLRIFVVGKHSASLDVSAWMGMLTYITTRTTRYLMHLPVNR
jgi:hypothetical protein